MKETTIGVSKRILSNDESDARNIIVVKDLTKKFGSFTAVDHVNLTVKEGEIFGFLGPNGAGKTTTISVLTTLIKPTEGTASIAGHNLVTEGSAIRSIIGVVPQTFALFPELTAMENLTYIGKLYGMSKAEIKERSDHLLKTVSLSEYHDTIANDFSGGMKQLLSLAASIMSSPKILFMDEPTNGLDPESRIAVRELTKELNQQGTTIIYTTHDMAEAEKICNRIVIMDGGRIIATGTGEELKHLIPDSHAVEIELESPSERIIEGLRKLPFVTSVQQKEKIIRLTITEKRGIFYKLSGFFRERNQKVIELRFKEPSLEDVFIHLTKKNLRD